MMDPAVINNGFSSSHPTNTVLNDLPTDTRLPQLPIILDMEIMREKFQDCLFVSINDQTQFVVRQCEIIQIRYKPASSCMVSYRLGIENTSTREHGEQILCGRAFPEGCSQSQWEKAGARALVQPCFGKPLIHLSDLEMVLWSFPSDRKMHTLPAAIDATHSTSETPPSWLLSHVGTGWRVAHSRSRLMHYVGEHSCTMQTSIELIHPSQNTRQTLTIFGKTYYNEDGVQTDRVMRQLWDSAPRRSGQLHMAQPLWYDARLKTLWQLGIHGTTLENNSFEAPAGIPILKKAAHAVATFHTTPVSNIPPITVLELLGKLEVVTSMLMRCRPSCRSILIPLRDRLIDQAKTISVEPTTTLHGDLHMKNLFLTHDRIALIDLDNVCQGHPGQDIGSFVAGLLTGALAKQMPLSQAAGPLQTFLQHYNQCAPWKLDQPTLAWFTAVALVTERSYRCVTRLKDGRLGLLDSLLNLAHEISKVCALPSPTDESTATCERTSEQ